MASERAMTGTSEGRLEPPARRPHRCPAWAAPFLANPLRRLFENPETLLDPWVAPGTVCLDVGCGTGFFALPLARMTGKGGRVLCVDVEPRMLKGLVRRAGKAGLLDRIEPIGCGEEDLGLSDREGSVDVAVAIHSLHELSDIERGLRQITEALKPGGRLVVIEPRGHVSRGTWDYELESARRLGLVVKQHLALKRRFGAVLEKP